MGQFLVPKLLKLGHDVYCVEEYFFRSMGKLGIKNHNLFLADIKDSYALAKVMMKVRPNVVIHLAAMTAVAYSYEHFYETTMTNYIGTINMAEITRLYCPNLKQFIFPSSAEVYGVNKIPLKKETDRLVPNSPYAVAKSACEDYLMSYMYNAFKEKFPVTIFRPFNSYGRKNSNWFVVERTIWQMLRGQPVCNLGDPEPVRDFLYIENHADAYIKALNNPKAIGEVFNLSTGVGVTIKQLANLIRKLTRFKGKIKWATLPRRPLDIMHLIGSNEKLKSIGWKEPVPLAEGLNKTINYWRHKIEETGDYYSE